MIVGCATPTTHCDVCFCASDDGDRAAEQVPRVLPGRRQQRRLLRRGEVRSLDVGLHVIEICLHVLHVNVVTYVIFFFTYRRIYM